MRKRPANEKKWPANWCENDRQMRKNDRQIDAKFDNENVFKVRPGKMYKVWPKSSAENCKRKQMQSISAMNSQSSINWVQLRNLNLWFVKTSTEASTLWDASANVDREASTFSREAGRSESFCVDRDHVVRRSLDVNLSVDWDHVYTLVDSARLSLSVDWDHVVHVVVSKSVNLRVLSL